MARRLQSVPTMAAAIDIQFRGMTANPSIEAAIERWVGRLETVCALDRCSVEITRTLLQATGFRVDIDVWFADTTGLEDSRATIAEHDDVYVAVSNAFRGSYRQLNSERGRLVRPATPSVPATPAAA